ncbi:SDR family NAD(P)-dependent oxidoreductase [Enterovirga sp. CN4-39]|uniref:SDR family NAD(P)-dependent oxidoreductase n=1 Tax=Enterovirga sp. CN4-39 TaxID=3400910 RepID=UPI003C11927D
MSGVRTFDLTGKRILITGASGGIGSATAELCASLGAEVLACDIVDPAPVVGRLRQRGSAASAHICDVADRDAVAALQAVLGDVDVLVDTVGLCPFGDWESPEWDSEFDRVIDANVRGPMNLARAFMPAMIQRRSGRIVLTGSLAGHMGGLKAKAHYAASKGAVHALVRWLAQRATPHNVLVNGIAPGTTATRMAAEGDYDPSVVPMGRFATPEEIAGPIAFLCSPAAGYIAGAILDVNGGTYYG